MGVIYLQAYLSYSIKVYNYFNLLFCLLLWLGIMCKRFLLGDCGIIFELDIIGGSILHISVPFILDCYSVVFSFVVVLISICVIYYNGFYIDGEDFYNRFCKLVLLFVLSILFLVIIPNFLGLIIG